MVKTRVVSPPRQTPTSGFEVLDNSYLLEEETFSWYRPDDFYPVQICEIFRSRYQVLGKLGYGSVSTAWLCRDLTGHAYVTLKVFVSNHSQASNEKRFQLPGKLGPHECLIHDPLGLTLADIREMYEGSKVPPGLVKPFTKYLLMALDFLHTKARVVHTDIQEDNIMLGMEDDTVFKEFEQEEWAEPSLRKIDGDRIIYETRQVDIPDNPSHVVLCDFGEARFGEETYVGEVMPDFYRAPEIVLGIPWNEKIDIWSVGLMVWDLFEGKRMFTERLPNRNSSESAHTARMIALMGQPPKELLKRGQFSENHFDKNGNFKHDIKIQKTSLEEEEENLEGDEKIKFIRFLRKMLQWLPEDRKSAKELMNDPWLEFD
ncbi:hypothetical protein B7463_g1352, partial [Scytalidium lignicola]